jgi:hypothetical protein
MICSGQHTFLVRVFAVAALVIAPLALAAADNGSESDATPDGDHARFPDAQRALGEGRQIFRFDTFGDEGFWGDTLKLHQAIEGSQLGGVGPGVSPKTALAVGLKVDVDALPGP